MLASVSSALRMLVLSMLVLAGSAFGKSQHEKMVEKGQIYRDGELTEYVSAVGRRMAKASGADPDRFEFFVQDSMAVNAMATANDHVYVSRGLLAYLDREDQLAAVLGHEIGHLTAGHHAKRRSATVASKVLSTAAGILTGSGQLAQVGGAYSSVLISGYGREMELEADSLGAKYLARAGYDSNAMIDVIRILKDQETYSGSVEGKSQSYHGLFATHPRNDRRLYEVVHAGAGDASQQEYVEPVGDYLERLGGLAWGDAAASGLVQDSRYYHRRLGFVVQFPDGWQVRDSPAAVSANPLHGTETTITLEAVEPERSSPKRVIAKQLEHEIAGGRKIEVDGMEGYLATLASDDDAYRRRLVAVVLKDDYGYVFTGENRREDYENDFIKAFSRTVASFRKMTPEDAESARSQRIKIIKAEPDDTYQKLARRSSLGRNAADRLRLLNGDYPRGQPRAGDRIKIIQ